MVTDKKNIARWQPESSRGIVKRIIATGTLVLETPAHFGAGEQAGNDLMILEDALENKPLIPGASLAGALRHYLWQREKGYRVNNSNSNKKTYAERLFGTALEPDSGHQSRVIVDDALGDGSLTIRDGVKIDGVTRTAEDGALFTVQVWERGTTFDLRFELCIYEDDGKQQSADLEQAFAVALHALGNGEIPLGARKHRGYGRASVSDWDIQSYDMTQASHLSAWLTGDTVGNTANVFLKQAEGFTDKRQFLRIKATLNLCDSLLIRAGSDVAKVSHLTSKGKPVVSGTSIIGALRARALKIAQSIDYDRAQDLINDMFGKHGSNEDEDGNKTASDNDMSASRVMVEERLIDNPNFNYIQNRIKIDRFTGGAYDTALFTEQPVFANDDTLITLNLELRFPDEHNEMIDAQAGLLMLVLKDLWTEDLPLGGESSIGRGRLRGNTADIELKTESEFHEIKLNQSGLVDPAQGAILQEKVDALWKYLGGEA